MSDADRIAELERRIDALERENAKFKFQWLDRYAYGRIDSYKPPKGNEIAPQIPEAVKEFWRGDGWKG